jgi:hypothetical protein
MITGNCIGMHTSFEISLFRKVTRYTLTLFLFMQQLCTTFPHIVERSIPKFNTERYDPTFVEIGSLKSYTALYLIFIIER